MDAIAVRKAVKVLALMIARGSPCGVKRVTEPFGDVADGSSRPSGAVMSLAILDGSDELPLVVVVDEAIEPCLGESSGLSDVPEDVVEALDGLENELCDEFLGDSDSWRFREARSGPVPSCLDSAIDRIFTPIAVSLVDGMINVDAPPGFLSMMRLG